MSASSRKALDLPELRLSAGCPVMASQTAGDAAPLEMVSSGAPKDDISTGENVALLKLQKNIRGILNKLTPQKFEKLVGKMLELPINTEDHLREMVNLVFEKAVNEPLFSNVYADLTHRLQKKVIQRMENSGKNNPVVAVTFRKLLLNKCQEGFEKNKKDELDFANRVKEIEETADPEKKKELKLLLDEDIRKITRKSVGLVRFIGELYKLHMLTPKIMHGCISTLLSQVAEEPLECVCKLLMTIGKELERESGKKDFDDYFAQISKLAQKTPDSKVSPRVRFMLQDVIELRQKNWKPRKDENNPKTVEQLERDTAMETKGRDPGDGPRSPRYIQYSHGRPTSGNKYRMGSSSYTNTIEAFELQYFKSDAGDAGFSLGVSGAFSQWTSRASTKRPGGLADPSRRSCSNNRIANRFALLGQADSSDSRMKYSSSMGSEQPSSRGGYQLDNRKVTKTRVPDLHEEEGLRKAEIIFDEWCANNNAEETLSTISDTFIGQRNGCLLVRLLLDKAIEGRTHICTKYAELLVVMLQEEKLITSKDVITEFQSMIEYSDDMVVDIPFFWSHFGQIFGPLICNEVVSFNGLKTAMGERSLTDRAKVVSEVFRTLQQNEKTSVWTSSNAKLTDFVPENEIDDFVKSNNFWFLDKAHSLGIDSEQEEQNQDVGSADNDGIKEDTDGGPSNPQGRDKPDKTIRKHPSKKLLVSPKKPRNPLKRGTGVPLVSEAIDLLKSLQSNKQDKDEFDLFGEQVALKLRKLFTPPSQFVAQNMINNILFEAATGIYDVPLSPSNPSTSSSMNQTFSQSGPSQQTPNTSSQQTPNPSSKQTNAEEAIDYAQETWVLCAVL